MTSKKLFFVQLGIIVLLFVMLIASTMLISSTLKAKSNELVGLKAKSQALDQQKIALAKAKKDIQAYNELYKISKTIVPEDKSQAEAVRQIVKIAQINGVSLASISFPASTLGAGITSVNGTGSATTPVPQTNKKSLSQLQPVKNIPGVYLLQITVASDTNKPVPYSKFIDFLAGLEGNRRTAQVSNITLQPDQNNKNNITFTLTLNQYIKP